MSSSRTQQALVLTARDKPLSLQTVLIPEAVPGSAVIRVLATSISPSTRKVLAGEMFTALTPPLIPSSSAIGRIHSVGPDATALAEGQLVFGDFFVRGRDDADASILLGYMGGVDAGSAKLMEGEWRNGTYAEYAKLPLENIYPLNEELLVNHMRYSFADLTWLNVAFVNAGGLLGIGVQPGDTVIVAPSTGYFSGGGVHLALALGARVIAAARNQKVLSEMTEAYRSTGRLTTVALSGDVETDTAALKQVCGSSKGADIYLDWSPPQAAKSTHIQACLSALKPFGKCILMGAIFANIEIPYLPVMRNSIRIQGRYMFEREHALQVIKMTEAGLLRLGPGEGSSIKVQAGFKLGDVDKAFDAAEEYSGWGNLVVLEP